MKMHFLNCAYTVIDDMVSFDEAMFILLCGTGVGFSVEKRYTNQLPTIPEDLIPTDYTIVVADSKEGWATAQRDLIQHLYNGEIPYYDTSLVRPEGSRLKTFGGRASGPEPLIELFKFTIELFQHFEGKQLPPIACHDLMCKTGEVVVVGGVRRSAMISLSDLDDEDMANAKGQFPIIGSHHLGGRQYSVTIQDGVYGVQNKVMHFPKGVPTAVGWWELHPERRLANNSAVYEKTPDAETFLKEWSALVKSKAGERGIFSRAAAKKMAIKHGCRDADPDFGCNPCSEIILRPHQFCNLSEVVVKKGDSFLKLMEKVEIATVIGTYQSRLTHFPYLRPIWQENTEEEMLLGVSLTGIMDHEVLSGHEALPLWLNALRDHAVETNQKLCEKKGIRQSLAITCVKPSGTVSQLVDASSGIHPRYSPYYIRTVRGDIKDPMTQFLKDAGIPNEPDITSPDSTVVFSFPIKSPEGAITRHDQTALEQLEIWKIYQDNWCEHKPSCTVSVKDEEWMEVGAWVYRNFDDLSGISFLPYSDHIYKQAPYQEITKAQYEEALRAMPQELNWDRLQDYEKEDNTVGSQTLACTGSSCELVDISS